VFVKPLKIEKVLNQGLIYLESQTWPDGMTKAYGYDRNADAAEYADLTTFTSGLTALMLLDIDEPNAKKLYVKTTHYLKSEILRNKFWMWSAMNSHLRKIIPIDVDSTSINSEVLFKQGIILNNTKIIYNNRLTERLKGFYTWIIVRPRLLSNHWQDILAIFRHSFYQKALWKSTTSRPHETNDLVSANVYHYLILRNKNLIAEAETFLEQFSGVSEMKCSYYINTFFRHFLVSRVLAHSNRDDLKQRFLPKAENLDILSDMELSCFILCHRNMGFQVDSDWLLALAERQNKDGSFNAHDSFCESNSMIWRSPGFNTALALNALVTGTKYCATT